MGAAKRNASTTDSRWDLAVVGGGAAGLAAARAAVARGARTLLVSAGPLGGDCTHTGCVPSKALIEAAGRGASFDAAMAGVSAAVTTIAATETAEVLASEGIAVRFGRARLAPGGLTIDGEHVAARRIVLATGSVPAIPPIAGLAEVAYLTNETVFSLQAPPGALAVIGGGPIGCELAQAFARLGVRVTLIEATSRLLPAEVPEASEIISRRLGADGVTVRLSATVARATRSGGIARLVLADDTAMEVTHILVATGRRPATEGLGLAESGVAVGPGGHIVTDARLRTSRREIYAAGDVTGVMPFTHVADEMGRVAAENALSRRPRRRLHLGSIPSVTFTDPEVARVGVSAANAPGERVAYLPMSEVDRAIVAGHTDGFVSLIARRRRLVGNLGGGRLVGATIVAPRAGEMIHEPALAIRTGMFAGRLAQTVHAYPTWSVAIRMAAAQFVTTVNGRTVRPAESSHDA